MLDLGMTTEKENDEMQQMTSFGRPFRNNAYKVMIPMRMAPPAEVKHFSANRAATSSIGSFPTITDLVLMKYAPSTVTEAASSRTTNRIHLQFFSMKINFRLIAGTVNTSLSFPVGLNVRVIIVRTDCKPAYTNATDFLPLLLSLPGGALTTSSAAPYNPYYNSVFQVLYDQQVNLCSPAMANAGGSAAGQLTFYPFYIDYWKSLSINLDLNNMLTEYPSTTINTTSEAIKGGLYMLTCTNEGTLSTCVSYDATWRVRFLDR